MKPYVDLLPAIMPRQTPFGDNESPDQMKEACQGFEAILLQQMIRKMRATVPEGGLVPKSAGTKILEEMMDEQLAQELAKTGSVGIADLLFQQITSQGVSSPKTSEKV